jgi:Flp pilus assembly protein TadG
MPRITRLREDSGAALVEYALVLPLLLLLVFGMLDFGRAFNYWIDTTHLANEAARFASVDRDPSESGDLQGWIRDQALSKELYDGSGDSIDGALRVCIAYPEGSAGLAGDPVEVKVKTSFRWLRVLDLPLPTTDIVGKSTMRLEKDLENVSTGGDCPL